MRFFIFAFIVLISAGAAFGQNANRPRVFIEESDSWEVNSDPI